MNDLHLLRYCAAVLCVCVLPECISGDRTTRDATSLTSQTTTQPVIPGGTSGESKASTMMSSTATVPPAESSPEPSPKGEITTIDAALPTATDAPKTKFVWRACVSLLMVTGGLFVACTILLVTTLMLVWKLCQLSRRLRALGGHDDLISYSECWIGTARKNKKSKHKSEAAETGMVLTGFSQTQELGDNGAEGEGTATCDGQKEEEKQAHDEVQSGEDLTPAPQITAENPKEENPITQDNKAEATLPECDEETKAVV